MFNAPELVNVVNVPAAAVVAPMVILLIEPIVAGLIVTLPVPVGCKLTLLLAGFRVTVLLAVNVPVTTSLPVTLKSPPTFKFLAMPTPPLTTTAPLVVPVLCVVDVNVVAPLLVNVVNAPLLLVVAPILILSMLPAVVGLITTVPLGLRLALVVAVKSVNVPAAATVPPIVILSIVPKLPGLIVT